MLCRLGQEPRVVDEGKGANRLMPHLAGDRDTSRGIWIDAYDQEVADIRGELEQAQVSWVQHIEVAGDEYDRLARPSPRPQLVHDPFGLGRPPLCYYRCPRHCTACPQEPANAQFRLGHNFVRQGQNSSFRLLRDAGREHTSCAAHSRRAQSGTEYAGWPAPDRADALARFAPELVFRAQSTCPNRECCLRSKSRRVSLSKRALARQQRDRHPPNQR